MKRYLLAGILAALLVVPAKSDWTGLNAAGSTITFKNPNACTSVACVPVAQPVDGTGASFGVTANPFFIGFGTGVTLPAYAATPTFNMGTIAGIATQATLASVLSALGSPFQAGGSIGNTSFAATQATASALNATVVGTGTFATQAAQSGTWNITNISGTVSLPTGAATAAKQPALGTAGSASTDILTVQGIASMTPLLATLSGTNNINNISGTISLPTGAATSALQTTGNTALTTINTTLGSPFQAGGSIGNTTFAVTQATAANLNMTCANCSGSGTDEGAFTAGSSVFAPGGGFFQTTATSNPLSTGQWGAWQMTANRAGFINLRNASGTEIGTSSTPVQVSVANTGTNGTAMLVTGTGGTFPASQSGVWSTTVTQATGTNLHMVCDSGCSGSGGTSSNFGSAFPAAGTAIGLTNGTNMIGWSATTNYGTSPGAIAVPAVNADVTNSVTIGTLPALVAGSAIIGKVGIDQTTPGATNGVQVNAALPAGTNLMGKVGIDQTTPGTTNGVQDAATSATAASPPAKAIYTAANGSGNLTGEILCDNFITYDASTSGSTQLVALSSGKTIYVCGYTITTGATATSVKLIYGTGSACATSPQPVTPAYQLGVNSGVVDHASNHWGGMKTAASNELCINASAANAVQATVYYTQF